MVRKFYKVLICILLAMAVIGACRAVSAELRENSGCPIGYHIEKVVIDWCVVDKK